MQPAIRVEKLSKQYCIGGPSQPGYRTLRESLTEAALAPWRRLRNRDRSAAATHWALKDVSFEVQPGEVVGIIGRNGAGKSTLLKILSRITEPTTGRAEFRGRIGSLLEVGTGFHAELTGRENIYLNGSILGMTRREIDAKFDEIVAFSEVERFLETPVKRYSSGMYVRLAFAVAAHLNPEILVIDEVLAVGDATYQRRCINRMSDLAASGATILFVSHNMDVIPQLCHRAVLLDRGEVQSVGAARDVVSAYLNSLRSNATTGDLRDVARSGDGRARFTRVRPIDEFGNRRLSHRSGDDLIFQIEIDSKQSIEDVALAVIVQNVYGTRLITSWTREVGFPVSLVKGTNVFRCSFREARLRPGHRIVVGFWMATQSTIDFVDHGLVLDVDSGDSTAMLSTDSLQGILALDYEWSTSA